MGTSIEESCEFRGTLNETILSQALEIEGFSDYKIHPDGFVISFKTKKPKILKAAKTGYNLNYDFVVLREHNKSYQKYIHRLVAESFVINKNPSVNIQVNHKDGNTDNNKSDNLEWVTPKENSNHAVDNGLSLTGEKCPWAKTSEAFIRNVCKLLESGIDNKSIREITGIDSRKLFKIKHRLQWKQVSIDYKF